jgi:hypothetical protein
MTRGTFVISLVWINQCPIFVRIPFFYDEMVSRGMIGEDVTAHLPSGIHGEPAPERNPKLAAGVAEVRCHCRRASNTKLSMGEK